MFKIDELIKHHEGVKCVDSYDMYVACGCNVANYSRWVKDSVSYTFKGLEYFDIPPSKNPNNKIRYRYYLTLDLAATLCFNIKTVKSLRLRRIILRAKD